MHDGQEHPYCDRYAGYSLFINQSSPHATTSRVLGEHLGRALRAAEVVPTLHHAQDIPGERRELLDAELGLYRFDELAVLRTARSPSLLFEAGVIVHRSEETLLEQPPHRRTLVGGLVSAVKATCEQVAKKHL
jgi:N-acetylmuramoyl-L-alanine amidase